MLYLALVIIEAVRTDAHVDEWRWKDPRNMNLQILCLHLFMFTRGCSSTDGGRDSLYLFIKHWEDRIYVNTLNDHLNISCQMSIESPSRLPVMTNVILFVYINYYNYRFLKIMGEKHVLPEGFCPAQSLFLNVELSVFFISSAKTIQRV